LHEREIEGEMKENEENRDLDNKKDYDDEFIDFLSIQC